MARHYGRWTVTAFLVLLLLSLLSCSGGDSGKKPATDTGSVVAAGGAGGSGNSPPSTATPAVSADKTRQTAGGTDKLLGTSAPRSYPSLPDAVTAPPEWVINDAPFDMVRYFAAPPDNAAPLYLDALFEFSPEDMGPCLSKEGFARHGRIRKARAERTNRIADAVQKDPKAVDPATIDALLAEFAQGFQLLALAQQRKACLFERGAGYTALLPHLQAARQVGRLVALRASRDLAPAMSTRRSKVWKCSCG